MRRTLQCLLIVIVFLLIIAVLPLQAAAPDPIERTVDITQPVLETISISDRPSFHDPSTLNDLAAGQTVQEGTSITISYGSYEYYYGWGTARDPAGRLAAFSFTGWGVAEELVRKPATNPTLSSVVRDSYDDLGGFTFKPCGSKPVITNLGVQLQTPGITKYCPSRSGGTARPSLLSRHRQEPDDDEPGQVSVQKFTAYSNAKTVWELEGWDAQYSVGNVSNFVSFSPGKTTAQTNVVVGTAYGLSTGSPNVAIGVTLTTIVPLEEGRAHVELHYCKPGETPAHNGCKPLPPPPTLPPSARPPLPPKPPAQVVPPAPPSAPPALKVALRRYLNARTQDHWVTTGSIVPGYVQESALGYLFTDPQPGTRPLYGCLAGGKSHFLSPYAQCAEGDGKGIQHLRLEGYIYASKPPGIPTQALHRCYRPGDHFVSLDRNCEGHPGWYESTLGFAPTTP